MKISRKKRKKIIRYIIGLLVLVIFGTICGILFFKNEKNVPTGIQIDKDIYPVTGIDVSAHTGKIDFAKIRAQHIDFVYIKATEGSYFSDDNFEVNYKNAKSNNIPVGIYHFFSYNVGGREQANHFYANIIGKSPELPLVIDVEDWGNSVLISSRKVKTELKAFIDFMKGKVSNKLIFYTNEHGFDKYLKEDFDDYDIWICSFKKQPAIDRKWLFWQYSHNGKLDGAQGWVDLNTFNGREDEWKSFLKDKNK